MLLDLGDLQQDMQYYERALDIRIKKLGSDYVHVDVLFRFFRTILNYEIKITQIYIKSSSDFKLSFMVLFLCVRFLNYY